MKNADGLSQKQWAFAEEYIRHFNADEAYRKVYTSSQTRNAWIILKSRPLISYIRKRLIEKQASLDRNFEIATSKLGEIALTGTPSEKLQASKIIYDNSIKQKELEVKLKEIEKKIETPIQPDKQILITISEAVKPV